jgi:hypothetical protein
MVLPQVSPKDSDQLLGFSQACFAVALSGRNQMFTDLRLEHFGHQPVDGALGGGDRLQNVGAISLFTQGAFDTFDLTADAPDAFDQTILIASQMGH